MPAALRSPLVRIPAAAELLDVRRSTVYRWIAAGRLRSVCVGGVRYIPADEFDRLAGAAA